MFHKGISRRWFVNTAGVVFLVLAVSITFLSMTVRSSVYNGIELVLNGRMDELLNVLSAGTRGYKSSSEFAAITRDYIGDFPDKNDMEIMALSKNGRVLITSTGFAPDQTQPMPDYEEALLSPDNSGKWTGRLDTGEKVMAVTRVVRDDAGSLIGSVRYLVSMERADLQISRVISAFVAGGGFIMLLILLSGMYFIRSLVNPLRKVSATAQRIAQGDFQVRVEKDRDDEIGQLCDTINDMAGELGASERLKNDFISSVSHELRTPLTSIKGWAETLQGGADPETADKGMNVIIRESERLSGLVEELLDFSRLQGGHMRLSFTKIDLLSELDEAVYMFTARAQTEKKQLIYEENTSLPPVFGDVDRLRQVFVNILDNALKYTGEGGTITVSSREENGFIQVTIRDTGCGIPAEHLPNVKKKFYKANQLVRGSGIGLAVADEIAVMHGGSLTLESRENAGTCVTISLPTGKTLSQRPELITGAELQNQIKQLQERNG